MIHPAKLAATELLLAATALAAQGPADRQQARKLMDDGNYREALDQLRELTLAAETDPNDAESSELASDFRRALACFQQLNRTAEIDEYRERVAARHGGNWRLLAAVAQSYLDVPHHGFRIAGAFHRGAHRGGGEMMHATARDRVRALQLFRQALALVDEDPQQQRTPEAAALASGLASALMHGGYAQAWRLQTLTSLGELPDYEEGYGHHGAAPRGAPVDDEGRPVFYEPPASWDAAQNDGRGWGWPLARRTAWQPDALRRELRERADFLRSQFSVRTMADYGWWFARPDDDADVAKSTFDLPSLGENETIARLATGIQRLTLPDEHNFLKLLRRVAGDSTQGDGDWSSALATMAEELEDRRQLPRAAELWRELLAGSPNNSAYMDRLTQITGNWGRIEPATTQRAGRGATFDYRYRNGQRVDFTARPVKVRQLLDDVKAYLSSNPRQLNWQQVNLDQLGHRLVVEGQDKYLEAESARWSLDLDPRPGHADRRVTV
ncbi:MAG TPA: alpha-2-macroglobulin, partial [Lacipirellulaceae bacterium]|nr:alpha-2-macroglobulin [Lacipirellulaceae bacterium]